MLPEYIVFISIPVNFIVYYFYLRSIIYGQTRPNLVSWALWVIAPFIGIFYQLKAGAEFSVVFPVFMAGFGPLLVILLGLFRRNVYWKVSYLDYVCGFFAILSLVCYMLTHNLGFSVSFVMLSDLLAFGPVVKKSWYQPEAEKSYPFWMGFLNGTLSLLVITDWSFVVASYGVFLVVVNLAQVLILNRKKIILIFS